MFNSRLKLFLGTLRSKWIGAFKIKESMPYRTLEVEDPITKVKWAINGQRLKSYLCENDTNITNIPQDNP